MRDDTCLPFYGDIIALREKPSQINVILQQKQLAAKLNAVYHVIVCTLA